MRVVLASVLVLLNVGGAPARAVSQENRNLYATQQTSTLDALGAEERAIKKTRPEQWAKWEKEANEAYEEHKAYVRQWRWHDEPPDLGFKSLNLPLAFVAAQLRHLQAADGDDARSRFWGYLHTVEEHPDSTVTLPSLYRTKSTVVRPVRRPGT